MYECMYMCMCIYMYILSQVEACGGKHFGSLGLLLHGSWMQQALGVSQGGRGFGVLGLGMFRVLGLGVLGVGVILLCLAGDNRWMQLPTAVKCGFLGIMIYIGGQGRGEQEGQGAGNSFPPEQRNVWPPCALQAVRM